MKAAALLWFLLMAETVSAQEAVARALPNWLTGIIAVAVFLFLVFVGFLVNKAWFGDRQESKAVPVPSTEDYAMTNGKHYDTSLDMVRTADHEHAYANVVIQNTEDKITAM